VKGSTASEAISVYLSKSKFVWGIQCKKLLWNAYHAKERIPPPDAQTQAIFDQGHEVGDLARRLFAGGIEVGFGVDDLNEVVLLSQEAIKARRPVFEASFAYQGGYARADILNPVAGDAWDIIEVKSSTSLKDVYIPDVAFQAFVYAGSGLKIRRCFILVIDKDFVRHGEVDPAKFFKRHNVTAQVSAMSRQVELRMDEMFRTLRLGDEPQVQIGPHCDNPYSCPLHDHCWSFLPPNNVMSLYRGGKKGFKLLADGITSIKDIPDDFPLTANQQIQRKVALTGEPHMSKAAIKTFLRQLKYPVSYLDFETFGTAIPLFDGVRPYQQIPFQFSLHVVGAPGSQPEHHMFLADGRADPRQEFLQRLRDWLPDAGSIVAYNAQFELGRLRECCEFLPEFTPWLAGIEDRFVDLLKPFRAFRYHHPDQHGSASMKSVLPALTGKGYDHLGIREGGTASLEFLRVTFADVEQADRQRVRRQLEEYCGQDTAGMVWMVDALRKLCP
jgi:hypothetical protein